MAAPQDILRHRQAILAAWGGCCRYESRPFGEESPGERTWGRVRVLVQRVSRAQVTVAGESVGAIAKGLLLLVGMGHGDGTPEIDWMAQRIAGLRIFSDTDGKMNLSLLDVGGEALVVSQFTLYGNCDKGRRPSFAAAAPGPVAERGVEDFVEALRQQGIARVETGRFGASMEVELLNEGPVTLWVERHPEVKDS